MDASTKSSCKPKKIFISYPHKTSAHVALMQHIRNLLEERGNAIWLAQWLIAPEQPHIFQLK